MSSFVSLNGYEVEDSKARNYPNVSSIKLISNLTNGDIIKTTGYHTPGDGGGALYLIRNRQESDVEDLGLIHFINDNLVAELIIENLVNVKQFGAYGDGVHDDTEIIQKCVNYSYLNKIFNVFLPKGEYITSKPIEIYENVEIYGSNIDSTTIKKITNTTSLIENFDYDAILLLLPYDKNPNTILYASKIHDLGLVGNILEYDSSKNEENFQSGILGCYHTPKLNINNIRIKDVDCGLKFKAVYMSEISNIPNITATHRAIYVTHESQGLVLNNINTLHTNVVGVEVAGASYSTLSSVLVEWVHGGKAFRFNHWNGSVINCGYELGEGPEVGIEFFNSYVNFEGGYFCGVTKEGTNMFMNLIASRVILISSSFGYNIQDQEFNGKFARLQNSYLKVEDNNKIYCTFKEDIVGVEYSSVTIKNQTFDLTHKRVSLASDSVKYQFIDKEINKSPDFKKNNIYFGNINTPLKNSLGSLDWSYAYNKGDIGVINNPLVNGKALWICNRDNRFDTPISVGEISSIENNVISLSSFQLEDYDNTGLRLYLYATIKGVNSGAKGVIDRMDFNNNKLTLTSVSGEFVVGEKIQLEQNTYAINGDYLYIPIINGGYTPQRPTKSLVVGEMFFDRTLNKPIWYTGSSWVDSTGTQV